MEQLKRPILSFEARAERRDGSVAPFSLRIFEPDSDETLGPFCLIECPFLRRAPFKIFGIDAEQACELSNLFIERMLKDDVVRMVDEDGHELPIPRVSWSAPS